LASAETKDRICAYLLTNRDPIAAALDLSQIEGVKGSDALPDPTDAIALVEALKDLLRQIYSLGGVLSPDTRIAFRGERLLAYQVCQAIPEP
jgi:hypothetical protein